jgi:hypothetical protein
MVGVRNLFLASFVVLIASQSMGAESCKVSITPQSGVYAGIKCTDETGKISRQGTVFWWQAKYLVKSSFRAPRINPTDWFHLNDTMEFSQLVADGKIKLYSSDGYIQAKIDHEAGKCKIANGGFDEKSFVYQLNCMDAKGQVAGNLFIAISDLEKATGLRFKTPNDPLQEPLWFNDFLDDSNELIQSQKLPTYKTKEEAIKHQDPNYHFQD